MDRLTITARWKSASSPFKNGINNVSIGRNRRASGCLALPGPPRSEPWSWGGRAQRWGKSAGRCLRNGDNRGRSSPVFWRTGTCGKSAWSDLHQKPEGWKEPPCPGWSCLPCCSSELRLWLNKQTKGSVLPERDIAEFNL